MFQRSQEKELIDLGPEHYSEKEFINCQKMLFQINRLLGNYKDTLKLLKKLNNINTIMDVGCGGGLFILNLSRHFPKVKFIGNDVSELAISLALKEREAMGIPKERVTFNLLSKPALSLDESSIDVILATMVCHHMSDSALMTFLQQALFAVKDRLIINDLHRHPIAYGFYYLFSPLLFKNRLINHDGLISIKRGYTHSEWKNTLTKAGIHHYEIKWCFPFRWRVTIWKK